MLTQKRLKELVIYDPDSGSFTQRKARGPVKVGDKAGTVHKRGYLHLSVDCKDYKAHRLAFLYMLGYFPEHGVDHDDGVKLNNAWSNLKEATQACNTQNICMRKDNTSGFKGVCPRVYKGNRRWFAQAQVGKKKVSLGTYDDVIDAALARITWEDWCAEWSCDSRAPTRIKLRELGYNV